MRRLPENFHDYALTMFDLGERTAQATYDLFWNLRGFNHEHRSTWFLNHKTSSQLLALLTSFRLIICPNWLGLCSVANLVFSNAMLHTCLTAGRLWREFAVRGDTCITLGAGVTS